MVKEIPLQNGMVALVDDEDYERCMEYTWTYHNELKCVVASKGKSAIQLSRFVLDEDPKNKVVMHENRNNLDFTKSNLVYADFRERQQSSMGLKDSTSKYKGVSYDKSRSKWLAQASLNGKNKYLGRFDSEDEAAEVYNDFVRGNYGELTYVNIIGADNNKIEVNKNNKTRVAMARKRRDSKNKYKGVSRIKSNGKWNSRIYVEGKRVYLGYFQTETEAAKAYDKKAVELYGGKAILNFPDSGLGNEGKVHERIL